MIDFQCFPSSNGARGQRFTCPFSAVICKFSLLGFFPSSFPEYAGGDSFFFEPARFSVSLPV